MTQFFFSACSFTTKTFVTKLIKENVTKINEHNEYSRMFEI